MIKIKKTKIKTIEGTKEEWVITEGELPEKLEAFNNKTKEYVFVWKTEEPFIIETDRGDIRGDVGEYLIMGQNRELTKIQVYLFEDNYGLTTLGDLTPYKFEISESSDKIFCKNKKTKKIEVTLSITGTNELGNTIFVIETGEKNKRAATGYFIENYDYKKDPRIILLGTDSLPIILTVEDYDEKNKFSILKLSVKGHYQKIAFDPNQRYFRKLMGKSFLTRLTAIYDIK